jgi:hypothetical protein
LIRQRIENYKVLLIATYNLSPEANKVAIDLRNKLEKKVSENAKQYTISDFKAAQIALG